MYAYTYSSMVVAIAESNEILLLMDNLGSVI